jgi:assimilatory nitrate reductase catalytic subunit
LNLPTSPRRRDRERPARLLLSGQSSDGVDDAGPAICACFGVGLNVIRRVIVSGALSGAEEIGKALRAGTNCRSCLPELRKIIQARVAQTS